MPDREILDRVTLLLAKAREAANGSALALDNGEALFGFVLDHHDYMAMHCLLNLERFDYDLSKQEALHARGLQKSSLTDGGNG